jgi:hypothetical protein
VSAKRVSVVLLIAVLVLLAGGASQPKAGDASTGMGVNRRPPGLYPGTRSSAAPLAEPPCFVPGPPFDVRIDTNWKCVGDVVRNPEHDEYLVVWSQTVDAQTEEIWAARIGPEGVVRDTFKVAGEQGKQLYWPAVAYSPVQDQYLVAYGLRISGSGNWEISARRMSWDGSWMSNQFPIWHGADDQKLPKVAYCGAHDEYLVVYWNDWASGSDDIAAQRVRASDGALLSWRTIATGVRSRLYPDVAYNAARDEYLVVYLYYDDAGVGTYQVRGVRFPYDMGMLHEEIIISEPTETNVSPAVAVGSDEYLVVWTVYDSSSTDMDVRGRRVSGGGYPLGPGAGFDIAGAGSTVQYARADAAYSTTLGYLVALQGDFYQSTNEDVLGRFVRAGEDAASGELFPLFAFPQDQGFPVVACARYGHCLVAEDDKWDPDGMGREAIRGLVLSACPRVFLPVVLGNP